MRLQRFLAAGAFALAAAAASFGSAVAAAPTVLYHGQCVVTGGVPTRWDVYQEIFEAGSPTWLPSHFHKGAECILSVEGITSWWYQNTGIVTAAAGQSLYTAPRHIHTAGNTSGKMMAYMGIHVLEAGTAFRYDMIDPTAPHESNTAEKSLFLSTWIGQPPVSGTFTIKNQLVMITPQDRYLRGALSGRSYYTVVSGTVTIAAGGHITTLRKTEHLAVPRLTPARINATTRSVLAVTDLVPN